MIVDLESTGLNPRRDRILSVAALPIRAERAEPGALYSADLRNTIASDRRNILVHGIGPDRQAAGDDPATALMGFLERTGKQVLLAYHANFDHILLDRALREYLGVRAPSVWLDLAWLAPALCPEAKLGHVSLDVWLTTFDLSSEGRHSAIGDAYMTAELFLVLLSRAHGYGISTIRELMARAEAQAELAPGPGAGGP